MVKLHQQYHRRLPPGFREAERIELFLAVLKAQLAACGGLDIRSVKRTYEDSAVDYLIEVSTGKGGVVGSQRGCVRWAPLGLAGGWC